MSITVACIGCGGTRVERTAGVPANTACFVLPGSWLGVTRSYRVLASGLAEPAGDARAPTHHMRAAFHPDRRHLYITTLVRPETGPPYEIRLATFGYDPATCSIGPHLATTQMGADSSSNERVYGLEVDANGRWLYQTTGSAGKIHRFRLGEDRLPVPESSYDATQGGAVVCAQVRRLVIHPDGNTLYGNCNNGAAGPGVDLAIQVWGVGPDGALTLRQHLVLEHMDDGISDPVLHPSGRWLYQPVGTADSSAPHGRGGYILTFAVMANGNLRLDASTPVRILTPEDSLHEMEEARTREDSVAVLRTHAWPITLSIHPDGSAAYVALHVVLEGRSFPHEFVRFRLDSGGGRLVEVDRRPTALPMGNSSHHGGTLVKAGGTIFLYSYLTDYDTTRGGVVQQYRIGRRHELIPLDPPFIATGLRDGRELIVLP